MIEIDSPLARKRRSTPATFRQQRVAGSYTAGIVLAIAVVVSIAGSIITYLQVSAAFAQHNAVDRAEAGVAELYRLQLDEETGLRGYIASGQKLYLEPYSVAEGRFGDAWARLHKASADAGLQDGDFVVADLRRTHQQWVKQVAAPLIAHPNAIDALLKMQIGKALVDSMRGDFERLNALYGAQSQATEQRVQSLLLRAAVAMAALILLFGFAAIIADLYRSRTQVELERERTVADTLQRAFLSGWDAVPYLRVGTAYVSSTREAAVGGDLFDIHRVDAHRTLVVVADVSGKGLDAAVGTAQVKYSMRTLVEEHADPGEMLSKFNTAFIHSLHDLSSFVSVFTGILDDRDRTLRYASAGHAPVFIRRGSEVEQLPVTGPLVGLTETADFSSVTVAVNPDDILVLATDGLTEARDAAGVLIDDEGVMRWIRDGDADPQRLAADLVRKVRWFAGGRIVDDLALIIVQVESADASRGAAPKSALRREGGAPLTRPHAGSY